MKTSYFAKYKLEDGINIASKKPLWFNGPSYPALYPKKHFLFKYFEDHDVEAYTKAYYAEVLDKLDPHEVYEDLKDKTLLCYEKSGDFCHRRLVAEWIEKHTGNKVEEYV